MSIRLIRAAIPKRRLGKIWRILGIITRFCAFTIILLEVCSAVFLTRRSSKLNIERKLISSGLIVFRKLSAIEAGNTNLNLVNNLIRHIHVTTQIESGSILVFLSGWEEQQRLFKIMVQVQLIPFSLLLIQIHCRISEILRWYRFSSKFFM